MAGFGQIFAGLGQGFMQGQDMATQLEQRKLSLKAQQQELKDKQTLLDAAPILLKLFQQGGQQGPMPQGGGPGGASAMPPGQPSQPSATTQGMPQQGPMPQGGPPQAQGGPLRPPMPQPQQAPQQPQAAPQQAPQQPGGQAQVPDPQVILQKIGQQVQRALPPGASPALQKAVMDEYFDYLTKATAASQPEVRAAIENARIASGIYRTDQTNKTRLTLQEMRDTTSGQNVLAQQAGADRRAQMTTDRAMQVQQSINQRVQAGQVSAAQAKAWSDARAAASAELANTRALITAAVNAGAPEMIQDPNDPDKIIENPKLKPLFDARDKAQAKLDKVIERAGTLGGGQQQAAPAAAPAANDPLGLR